MFIKDDDFLEDIYNNPQKYGAPSFEEFKKNPEMYKKIYLGHKEEVFEQIDKGSVIFKKGLKKFRFEIDGYKCDTLEEAQRIAHEQGHDPNKLDFKAEFIGSEFDTAQILVKLYPRKG